MTEPVRTAVVGLGAVARAVHLPILTRRADLVRIVGICDVSPRALAVVGDRFAVPEAARFADLEGMLEEARPEALMVLHSGSHAAAVRAGLGRGLTVLCEKPLVYTLEEAASLEAAARGGGRLMVGYMKVHDPAVGEARLRLAGGPRPRSVEVTVLHPTAASQLAHSELGPERVEVPEAVGREQSSYLEGLYRKALGGAAGALGRLYGEVLLGSLIHDLAVLRALDLELAEVDHAERWPAGAHPPSVAVLGRTADGVRLSLRWHYLPAYPAYREEVRVHREGSSLALTFPSPYLLHVPTELTEITGEGARVRQARHRARPGGFEEEILALHRLATGGSPAVEGLGEARRDTVTCQRIAAALADREGLEVGGEAGRHDTEPASRP